MGLAVRGLPASSDYQQGQGQLLPVATASSEFILS